MNRSGGWLMQVSTSCSQAVDASWSGTAVIRIEILLKLIVNLMKMLLNTDLNYWKRNIFWKWRIFSSLELSWKSHVCKYYKSISLGFISLLHSVFFNLFSWCTISQVVIILSTTDTWSFYITLTLLASSFQEAVATLENKPHWLGKPQSICFSIGTVVQWYKRGLGAAVVSWLWEAVAASCLK